MTLKLCMCWYWHWVMLLRARYKYNNKRLLFHFRNPLLILLYCLIFTNIFRNTSFHLLPASHPFINGTTYHSALLVLDVRSVCCSGIQCPFCPRPNVSVSLLNPHFYLRTFVILLSFSWCFTHQGVRKSTTHWRCSVSCDFSTSN